MTTTTTTTTRLCLLIVLLPLTLTAGHQKLLLILLDGLRHDYVTKMTSLPGFQAMAKVGVVAKFVRPSFPTLNYPSYYTLLTGTDLFFVVSYESTRESVGPSVRRLVRNLFFRRAATKTANDLCRVSGLVSTS